jgi:hypothetical protein
MKKILIILFVFLISLSSYGQLIINQTILPVGPYQVGDTLTIKYVINRGFTTPTYFWLRYQYNNKALTMIPNSSRFNQGSSTQTFYTQWDNYKFVPSSNVSETDLYRQYIQSPWGYIVNSDYNVGQLTVQRADTFIDGELAVQKYIIKDNSTYENIHKLDMAYSSNDKSVAIGSIITNSGKVSLDNVSGNTSQFKVRVFYPIGYPITDHMVQLMKLKNDGSGDIDWNSSPIAQLPIDSSGEVIFNSQIKVGDSVGVYVTSPTNKIWMDNIITVSDAYKSFLGHVQTDILGNKNFFIHPNLEKLIGNVSKDDDVFNEFDSYFIFAHIMGIDVSNVANIPSYKQTTIKWYNGILNEDWLNGVIKNNVYINEINKIVNIGFIWGGDLNWSHSTSPSFISSVTNNISNRTIQINNKPLDNATLDIESKLENDKVILTTILNKENLAGLEIIMNYDTSKLKLEKIVFDTGSHITNFSTDLNGRLTFGSMDQLKTSRIKVGTPYKLIFTPKIKLNNTSGLFYFILSDAVNGNGDKINLIIK